MWYFVETTAIAVCVLTLFIVWFEAVFCGGVVLETYNTGLHYNVRWVLFSKSWITFISWPSLRDKFLSVWVCVESSYRRESMCEDGQCTCTPSTPLSRAELAPPTLMTSSGTSRGLSTASEASGDTSSHCLISSFGDINSECVCVLWLSAYVWWNAGYVRRLAYMRPHGRFSSWSY